MKITELVKKLPWMYRQVLCLREDIEDLSNPRVLSVDSLSVNGTNLELVFTNAGGQVTLNTSLAGLQQLEIPDNVQNFAALSTIVNPALYQFAYVRESQGIQWVNYRGAGLYMWDGTQWTEDDSDIFSQLQVLANHMIDTGNPHSVTAAQIGLGNVDNTADADKPISSAQQAALDGKVDDSQVQTNVPAGAVFTDTVYDDTSVVNHIADTNNPHNVTATQVGLGNVDNTSDVNKPVSTAQQAALDLKRNLTAQKNSIEDNAGDLQLVGDVVTPGRDQYYGTDAAGNRVWQESGIVAKFNFNANFSQELYSDDFITFDWDTLNNQPSYTIPATTPLGPWNWHDINTMLVLGNSETWRRRGDDVSSSTGTYYFSQNGFLNVLFNMTNYGAAGFYSVMKETYVANFPRYTMHLMIGDTGHGSVIIYKTN